MKLSLLDVSPHRQEDSTVPPVREDSGELRSSAGLKALEVALPSNAMTDQACVLLELAGISIALQGYSPDNSPLSGTVFERFSRIGTPEVIIRADGSSTDKMPDTTGELIFEVPGRWALYGNPEQDNLVQWHPFAPHVPVRMLMGDKGFTRGTFITRLPTGEQPIGYPHPHPLEYPLGEILMVCLLAQQRGLMVHGCAMEYQGRGLVFAGNSGDGKSTLARLWGNSARLLNDDRVVIRESGAGYSVFPTPWHGTLTHVTTGPTQLETLFVLRQGEANHVRRLTPMQASSLLLSRSFVPWWDRQGMAFSLDFAVNLVSRIACWELTFVSDETVVEFLQGL